MTTLYRLIHAKKANYPIVLLRRVLHEARSSYYACREAETARQPRRAADNTLAARQPRRAANDTLTHEITVLHITSRHTYSVPRIHTEPRHPHRRANRNPITHVTHEPDIPTVTHHKHHSPTRPDKKAKPTPDLIGRDFHAKHPGIKLVGDTTYLPTAEG